MATIQLELPDNLAQDAERAGLLSSASIEQLLREQLRAKALSELRRIRDRMTELDDTPYMSPEDVAEEITRMRAERAAAKTR